MVLIEHFLYDDDRRVVECVRSGITKSIIFFKTKYDITILGLHKNYQLLMRKSKIAQELFRSKNVYSTLLNIKLLDYENASKKIKQALSHPITKRVLYHDKSKPVNFRELRNTKQLRNTGNLEGELAWYINSLKNFTHEINDFLGYEKEFERLILFDEYEKAKELVNEINEKVCYSFWAIENLFSVEEKLKGTESNWSFLKEINSQI